MFRCDDEKRGSRGRPLSRGPGSGCIRGVVWLLALVGAGQQVQAAREAGESLFWESGTFRKLSPSDGAYQVLSKHLRDLEKGTDTALRASATLPDEEFLLRAKGTEKRWAMAHLRRIWRDSVWTGRWTTPRQGEQSTYVLVRDRRDPRQRMAEEVSATHERLAELSRLAALGEEGWKQLRMQDPDLANEIRGPQFQARVSLASRLSAQQLAQIAGGREVRVPFASLCASDQSLVRQAVGTMSFTQRGPDGTVTSRFDPKQLDQGMVVFRRTGGSAGSSGAPGMKMLVYSGKETKGAFSSGGEFLYPAPNREFSDERADSRQKAEEARDRDPRSRRRITIDPQEPERAKEPWPVRYLRSWSEQSGYPVCAWWPRDAPEGQERLGKEIRNQPAFAALTLLCEEYGCQWVRDGQWIRIRPINRNPGDRAERTLAGTTATKP